MALKKIQLQNVTVFKNLDLELSPGLNIFIGENGTGKTHIMRLIYSACKAVRPDVSFPQKVVRTFMPDEANIGQLVSRSNHGDTASVTVYSDDAQIGMRFTTKTPKWDAQVSNEEQWEKQLADLSCTFIPAKEILSGELDSEATIHDEICADTISTAKMDINADRISNSRKQRLEILQTAMDGEVLLDKNRFYLKQDNRALEFSLVSEGIRKLALLWQLIKNGTLEKGSILLWDEPEANLNPKYIPVVAEMLLALQRDGVQVFVSTHDYFLTKYFEIKRRKVDDVMYHSLFKENESVACESQRELDALQENAIQDTFIKMYKEELQKAMA